MVMKIIITDMGIVGTAVGAIPCVVTMLVYLSTAMKMVVLCMGTRRWDARFMR